MFSIFSLARYFRPFLGMVFYKNKQTLSVVVLVVVCVLIFLILRSFFRYGILLVRIDAGIKKYKDQSVRGIVQ